MRKKLGRVSCSEVEEIHISLRKVQGELHVEQRVYHLPIRPGGDLLPGPEGIVVPVDVLPDLVRVLGQTLERLVEDRLVHLPPVPEVTTMDAGESVVLRIGQLNSRREPRVPLRLRVRCRLLDAADSSSYKTVTGEIKDVSNGGAQVWLPERFSLFSRVEVFMRIGGLHLRGRAEVVGAAVHPKGRQYRHSIRWLCLNDEAMAALLRLTNSLADGAGSKESPSRL